MQWSSHLSDVSLLIKAELLIVYLIIQRRRLDIETMENTGTAAQQKKWVGNSYGQREKGRHGFYSSGCLPPLSLFVASSTPVVFSSFFLHVFIFFISFPTDQCFCPWLYSVCVFLSSRVSSFPSFSYLPPNITSFITQFLLPYLLFLACTCFLLVFSVPHPLDFPSPCCYDIS